MIRRAPSEWSWRVWGERALTALRGDRIGLVVLASGNGSNLQAIIDKVHGRAVGAGRPGRRE